MDQNFALDLISQTQNHEQWLSVVRFGLGTLLKNQRLLMSVIADEAVRLHGDSPNTSIAACAVKVFEELGLHLTLTHSVQETEWSP